MQRGFIGMKMVVMIALLALTGGVIVAGALTIVSDTGSFVANAVSGPINAIGGLLSDFGSFNLMGGGSEDPSNGDTEETGPVTLFQGLNFNQDSLGVSEDIDDLGAENWDGKPSSVKLQDGYRATLFDDTGFSGGQITVAQDSPSLHMNDKTSSVAVNGDACTVELGGEAGSIDTPTTTLAGARDTTSLALGDKISSLQIRGGNSCSVRVGNCPFFTTDLGCDTRTFNNDVPSLGEVDSGPSRCAGSGITDLTGWNDCISSAEVMGGDSCYATLFQHTDYGGVSVTVTGVSNNVHPASSGASTKISAANVQGGESCQATLYADIGLSGEHVTVAGVSTRLGWSGAASSVQITQQTVSGSEQSSSTDVTCESGSCLVPPHEDPEQWMVS